MLLGGSRPGAGRPKLTLLREVAAQYGTTPLEYLLGMFAAKAAPVLLRPTAGGGAGRDGRR